MSRKRRSTAPKPAMGEPLAAEIAPSPVIEETVIPEAETVAEALVVNAVQQAIEVPSDEALAIRRLRNTLIQKLFTPDRTLNSWTDLKATN